MQCKCGEDNPKDAIYCKKCGTKLVEPEKIQYGYLKGESVKKVNDKEGMWISRLATGLGIWGIINLVLVSVLFGGILLFFAVLIYASKSFKVIYIFGVIWLVLALIQLTIGAYDFAHNILLLFMAFVNFFIGGYAIYNTKKLEG